MEQMELLATVVYVISDEVTRISCLKEDNQSQMSDSEVIAFAILAANFFLKQLKMSPHILSRSRLNIRIHQITWECWYAIFNFLSSFLRKIAAHVISQLIVYQSLNVKKIALKQKRFLGSEYLGFYAITGEPLLVEKNANDLVTGGTINKQEVFL
jgi:hypothetical protein